MVWTPRARNQSDSHSHAVQKSSKRVRQSPIFSVIRRILAPLEEAIGFLEKIGLIRCIGSLFRPSVRLYETHFVRTFHATGFPTKLGGKGEIHICEYCVSRKTNFTKPSFFWRGVISILAKKLRLWTVAQVLSFRFRKCNGPYFTRFPEVCIFLKNYKTSWIWLNPGLNFRYEQKNWFWTKDRCFGR